MSRITPCPELPRLTLLYIAVAVLQYNSVILARITLIFMSSPNFLVITRILASTSYMVFNRETVPELEWYSTKLKKQQLIYAKELM